jgi:hypothetical protein
VQASVVTAPTGGYVDAVRRVLATADDALICVAFAQARGVHLVEKELSHVAKRGDARVVVTTTLGTSSPAALGALCDGGARLRVLNPCGATYHPKVFVGRNGDGVQAVVGSANLTSGLVANVEAGTLLSGTMQDAAIAELWSWAEGVWRDPRGQDWVPTPESALDEAIDPELLAQLVAVAQANPTVYTLGPARKPNLVREVTASGLWVETERSRRKQQERGDASAQLVPPRMLNLAWDTLRARGRLTNRELLEELRVHRSSFVCAILARLPDVKSEDGREIALRYTGART